MESRTMDFHGIALHVRPDEKHAWTMATDDVAAGYGVTSQAVRMTKARHADEIKPDEHFTSVTICDARQNGGVQRQVTAWTKRGVLRLGMFLTSDRAKIFRDWCEDIAVAALDTQPLASLPTHLDTARALVMALEEKERLAQRNAVLEPKADALDVLSQAEGTVSMQKAANMLGLGRTTLFRVLKERGIFQTNGQPYSQHKDAGRFEVKLVTIWKGSRQEIRPQVFVTAKGLTWLAQVLADLLPAAHQQALPGLEQKHVIN